MKDLKKQHGLTSIDEEQSLLLGQVTGHRTALNQTLSQEVETENRIHEIRQQLANFNRLGRIDPAQREKLHKKMGEILARLAKLSRKGGPFAQVRPSPQLMELFEQSRWG